MIRREFEGQFYLIAQTDHAVLSGEMARRLGNERFEGLGEPYVTAVGMHDAGWPLHDERPTLNEKGLPRDVFESNPEIALPVWTASSERAEVVDPYVGLLVSLHGLNLSVYATGQAPGKHESFDLGRMKTKFAVNQFQHQEVERQEGLRKKLGLRTDFPLRYGLAAEHSEPAEDLLRFRFRFLQAMDMLSLAICCTKPPAATTQDVHPRAGEGPLRLSLDRRAADLLVVDPWPFNVGQMTFKVPARRVPGRVYGSEEEFRGVYAGAAAEELVLTMADVHHA